ncbi:alpha/beta hydrolase [Paracrocinitomix mangrovi]|uniref:alpha/beta hydrolase n=1 Tax=Paracrocinitomix mangrovi TaxID=2862509 RepID=UPI001C8D42FE|nr:alpha/beta hydrolase [Paracrocinitomix mangrovi]UKN01959.1 alpha/beta hydrolase [Paracrocinitomix mangrovi]
MKRLIVFIAIFTLLVSCKKATLNTLAFPSVEVDQYEFIDYSEPELEIPDDMLNANVQQTLVSFTSVDQSTGDSYEIYGLYMGDTATISTDTVIYFCHGQSRNMDYYYTRQLMYAHLGGLHNYGVFMIDYRGYGMSEGTSSEIGLVEDANAGLDWLIDHGLNQDRCVYYGFSLGCIPLIEIAGSRTDFQPAKLICESPLASVEYLTQSSTVINVDADFVTQLNFENAENIKNVEVPYFWMHGTDDDYISIDNGELIYGNYNGVYKQALRVIGAKHADIPAVYGHENYLQEVLSFIRL